MWAKLGSRPGLGGLKGSGPAALTQWAPGVPGVSSQLQPSLAAPLSVRAGSVLCADRLGRVLAEGVQAPAGVGPAGRRTLPLPPDGESRQAGPGVPMVLMGHSSHGRHASRPGRPRGLTAGHLQGLRDTSSQTRVL